MTKTTWMTTLALLTGLFVVLPSCGGDGDDDEVTADECYDVYDIGRADAEASNPSCIECNYEAYWNIDDYDDKVRMWCYASGFGDHYDYDCLEACPDAKDEPKACCREAMDFVKEQVDALDLRGLAPDDFGI